MPNNISVKDGSSNTVTIKTTETGGVHVPHHNIDNLGDILASLESILTELQQKTESIVSSTQSGTWNVNNITGTVTLPTLASTSTLQTAGNNLLTSVDNKTPALGQALSAASTPVVLPAEQINALTPLSLVGISNFPATQTITGTVNTGLSQPLTDTQLRATAVPISGTIDVSSLPSLPTGSNTIGAISNTSFGISGTLPGFTATPTFNIGTAPTIAVTGTFWQTTQPVSGTVTVGNSSLDITAGSLPLPTGAATTAKQDQLIALLTRPTVLCASNFTNVLSSSIIAAPGAGLSLYIVGYVLQNESTTATLMRLSDGTDKARVLGQTQADGLPFTLPFPLKIATNTALTLILDSSNQCGYTVYYYIA